MNNGRTSFYQFPAQWSVVRSNTLENEKVNNGSVSQMHVASALILLQALSFQVHCLRCYEGVNCAMECDQCEGAACIRILRGGRNSFKPALALTCLPYDAQNYDGAPEGCRTRSADGSRICFCYSSDFCNRSSSRSLFAFTLYSFIFVVIFA